jgi:hypothetical protein
MSDNATSENKNRNVLYTIALALALGMFKKATLHMLVVGHTHCSLDQQFSLLKTVKAAPLGSLVSVMRLLCRVPLIEFYASMVHVAVSVYAAVCAHCNEHNAVMEP